MKGKNPLYKISMKNVPVHERPRERIIDNGPESVSNAELLSAVLGSGSRNEGVLHLSNNILAEYDLERLSQASAGELKKISGVSDAKACGIIAAMELGRRAAFEKGRVKKVIESPSDVARMLMLRMRGLKKEQLRGLYLDSKKRIIRNEIISVGGLNMNLVHPREVFGPAMRESAEALIIIHNHPSGDPAPSRSDIKISKKLARAGRLIGIELLDHVIIGKNEYVSLREEGLL